MVKVLSVLLAWGNLWLSPTAQGQTNRWKLDPKQAREAAEIIERIEQPETEFGNEDGWKVEEALAAPVNREKDTSPAAQARAYKVALWPSTAEGLEKAADQFAERFPKSDLRGNLYMETILRYQSCGDGSNAVRVAEKTVAMVPDQAYARSFLVVRDAENLPEAGTNSPAAEAVVAKAMECFKGVADFKLPMPVDLQKLLSSGTGTNYQAIKAQEKKEQQEKESQAKLRCQANLHYALGLTHLRSGNYEQAQQEFAQYVEKNDERCTPYYWLAMAEYYADKNHAALASIDKCLFPPTGKCPEEFKADAEELKKAIQGALMKEAYEQACAGAEKTNAAGAEALAEQFVKLYPGSELRGDLYAAVMHRYQEEGSSTNALRLGLKAIKADPEQPYALAWASAIQAGALGRKETNTLLIAELEQRAVRLAKLIQKSFGTEAPKDPEDKDTFERDRVFLGMLHGAVGLARFKGGDLAGAEEQLTKAVALNEEAASDLFNLLLAQLYNGHPEKAEESLAKYEKLTKGEAEADKQLASVRAQITKAKEKLSQRRGPEGHD